MKKNKMMRTASVLLVAALMTTSMISGTFAKYTTSATGTDTARVAKFGVNITANGTTFAKEYTNDSSAKTVVSSETDKNVVAPGTKGDMAKMTLTGTPEVAVKVSYEGKFDLNDQWNASGSFYCPLVIKVNNSEVSTSDCTTAEDFEKAVNDAISKYSTEYAPGTNLADKGNDSLTVSWEWPYAGDDTKDTALGNATNAGEVTLAVTTTVTQID